MSLKSIIKVANYYNVKYGFESENSESNYSLANLRFQERFKLGIGDGMTPAKEREDIAKIKAQLNSYDYNSSPGSLEEFERGFDNFIKACQVLAIVPSPAGNPFSMAVVGDNLAQGDYTSAGMNFIGALPWAGTLKKVLSAFKGSNYIVTLFQSAPQILKPIIKTALSWIAVEVKNVVLQNVLATGVASMVKFLTNQLSVQTLIQSSKNIFAKTGYRSGDKNPDQENFNQIDAAVYLANFLSEEGQKQVVQLSDSIIRQSESG